MLGSSALTFCQTKICCMALLHALGHICKFVLRCKNLYRIGPIKLCQPVVYFNQCFGAAHSKCWLKYVFQYFLHQKVEKGRKRKIIVFLMIFCVLNIMH